MNWLTLLVTVVRWNSSPLRSSLAGSTRNSIWQAVRVADWCGNTHCWSRSSACSMNNCSLTVLPGMLDLHWNKTFPLAGPTLGASCCMGVPNLPFWDVLRNEGNTYNSWKGLGFIAATLHQSYDLRTESWNSGVRDWEIQSETWEPCKMKLSW